MILLFTGHIFGLAKLVIVRKRTNTTTKYLGALYQSNREHLEFFQFDEMQL
jgi:hypothetical protein